MGHNNIWYSRPRKSGAESHKCKAGSCGLGPIRFWNIQYIPFSPFLFSRKWWPTEQWSSWTRSSGHKEIACAAHDVQGPVLRRRPLPCCPWVVNNILAMKQNLAEMQIKLNWMERLDMVNRPAPLAPELALYKDGERYEGGEKFLTALADFIALFLCFRLKLRSNSSFDLVCRFSIIWQKKVIY